MSLFSLFAVVVMAAEGILSPLADNPASPVQPAPAQPTVSFGILINNMPSPTPAAAALDIQTIPNASPSATPTPTPVTYQARKKHYAIALLGDSMIDTLGPDAPHLKNKLTSLFPATTFTILNYGVGATNIDYGIERLTNEYTYLGKTIAPLVSQSPDVVVVESFGYNPYSFDTGALEKHWLALSTIVDTLKNRTPDAKIIIAATITPNSKTFGDGAAGLAFSSDEKWKKVQIIKEYLDSTVKFAQSQNLPLADAYHPSMDGQRDGILTYINGGDHIHPSDAGKTLFAQKIADAIISEHLFE